MRSILSVGLVMVWCAAIVAPPRVRAANDGRQRDALHVLLVGNSYTRFNLLPVLLKRLADSAPGPAVEVESIARGGYTLRRHLRKSGVLGRIQGGHFSHVVLQGHSLRPIDREAEMESSVATLQAAIKAAGAQTVLYETWAREAGARFYSERPEWFGPSDMQARIGTTYRRLAAEYDARLAPVGTAFLAAVRRSPELLLYRADGAHPTLQGSYLAASVLYGAITGVDPRAAAYVPHELGEVVARRLRALAAAVLARELKAPVAPLGGVRAAAGSGTDREHARREHAPRGRGRTHCVEGSLACWRQPTPVSSPLLSENRPHLERPPVGATRAGQLF